MKDSTVGAPPSPAAGSAGGTQPDSTFSFSWRHPLSSWRSRWSRWWQSRLKPRDQIQLHQRNVYILPTGAGVMLGITFLVMMLASINYQLNLGYLLSFLLAGNVVVGVHVCHGTLRGLSLQLQPPNRGFAGQGHLIDITLVNPNARERLAIGLATYPTPVNPSGEEPWVYTDVPSRGQSRVQLRFVPERRGWQDLPMLTAETRYPMGTFRVWTIWRPATRVLVYPRPELNPPVWPLSAVAGQEGEHGASTVQGEWDGVRPYRQGDSMRWVVWRTVARSEHSSHWASRDQAQAVQSPLWLDWHALGALDLEPRVSRLTSWVLRAGHLGQAFGLRLPGVEIAPSLGPAHEQACLEALALC